MAFVSRSVLRFVLFIGGYVVYLILGATIFSAIEGPEEYQKVQDLRNMRTTFLQEHKCVSGENTCFSYLKATTVKPL